AHRRPHREGVPQRAPAPRADPHCHPRTERARGRTRGGRPPGGRAARPAPGGRRRPPCDEGTARMTGGIEFGIAATAVDEPGAPHAAMYRSLLAECELNRSLGFTTAWALEHHFSDYFPTPDILLLLGNLAPRFPDLGLGTAVIVTPWHNPLRLAEQIAMLSVLADAPLHLGLGRGTAKFEFDAFDMDMEESRQRFQESWEILQLALAGEPFSYKGELYQVPREVRVRPRPAKG